MIDGHKVLLIAAVDKKNGLGKDGDLAWRLKKEMQHFTQMTTETSDPHKQNMVVMGRSTWESIPEKFRPLPNRRNVVLTHNVEYVADGAEVADSLDSALALADDSIATIFIIGGARVYEEAIHHEKTDGIYLTKIQKNYQCDIFFPEIPEQFAQKQRFGSDEEGGVTFDYYLYTT